MSSSWLIFSIIPPAFFAITNFTEKYVLKRYLKKSSGASFMLLTAVIGLVIAIPIFFIFYNQIYLDGYGILLTSLSSFVTAFCWILYAKALSKDDVTVVIPLYQTITIFNYILGLIFLKETLTLLQIVACSLIMLGGISLSLDLTSGKPKLKKEVFVTMISCAFLGAVSVLLYKMALLRTNYWGTAFWSYLALAIFGGLLLITVSPWRKELAFLFRQNRKRVIGISAFNEIIGSGGSLIYNFALLLSPIALVSVVSNGFQPFFVLIFGILITIFLPKLGEEKIAPKHLAHRGIAILIMFLGTYLLSYNS
ncbi:MAG: EamA family transporter [Patescibacteria group bacterium]